VVNRKKPEPQFIILAPGWTLIRLLGSSAPSPALAPQRCFQVRRGYLCTSGFWPRVRAPVFLSSISSQTGRPVHCSFLFDPQKYTKSIELGPPTSGAFFFPLDHRGHEIWSPPPRLDRSFADPSQYLGLWGHNYVPVRPYAITFFGFSLFL
jgi:hypothetical protein